MPLVDLFLIALMIAALSGAPGISISSSPVSPFSIEASAFCRLSWKVRLTTSRCCSFESLWKFTAYPETRMVKFGYLEGSL